jgi:hypothetical protein
MNRNLDPKNVALVKLVYRLRQDIDLYRVVGLNADSLRQAGVGVGFWSYLQQLAHESVALTICRIYEKEQRYPLNSIPSIINILPCECSIDEISAVLKFSRKFGTIKDVTSVREILAAVFESVCRDHAESLQKLKIYRDKFGAHSEDGAELKPLPSLAEFESLFEFANEFYRLVSDTLLGFGPAPIVETVGRSAVMVMARLGIQNPRFDFEESAG